MFEVAINSLPTDQALNRRTVMATSLTTFFGGAIAFSTQRDAVAGAPAALLAMARLTGREAFGALIAWFVNRALNATIGGEMQDTQRPENLLGLVSLKPRPSDDKFHNSHAEPWLISNRGIRFGARAAVREPLFVELDEFVRADGQVDVRDFKDLNTPELKRLVIYDADHGKLLYPCGYREAPTAEDSDAFADSCRKYKWSHGDRVSLDYVRPFNDGKNSLRAFGVTCLGRDKTRQDLIFEKAPQNDVATTKPEPVKASELTPAERERIIDEERAKIRAMLLRQATGI